jgi:hypothetical protein
MPILEFRVYGEEFFDFLQWLFNVNVAKCHRHWLGNDILVSKRWPRCLIGCLFDVPFLRRSLVWNRQLDDTQLQLAQLEPPSPVYEKRQRIYVPWSKDKKRFQASAHSFRSSVQASAKVVDSGCLGNGKVNVVYKAM